MKYLQNRISESRLTLPAVAVWSAAVWVAGGLVAGSLWPQFALFALCTYLMIELNNSNALIRIYSRMVSCVFIVLSSAACFTFNTPAGWAAELLLIASVAAIFRTYRNRLAMGWVFCSFAAISLCSLFYIHAVFFAPVVWFLMAACLQSMGVRSFMASLFGLAAPYWFASVFLIYNGSWAAEADRISAIAHFGQPLDFSGIDLHQAITIAFVEVVALTGIIHYHRKRMGDKIRTRMLYNCFTAIWAAATALFLLQPVHYDLCLRIMIITASPLAAHFIALTHTRITNIAFCLLTAAAAALTAFNLWMP